MVPGYFRIIPATSYHSHHLDHFSKMNDAASGFEYSQSTSTKLNLNVDKLKQLELDWIYFSKSVEILQASSL